MSTARSRSALVGFSPRQRSGPAAEPDEARTGQRALVIGAGTGFSAAVLAAIGLEVSPLESSPDLAGKARELGNEAVEGPLGAGQRQGAPYDQVLIDGAVQFIPDPIVEQLADGGRLGAAWSTAGSRV